MQVASRVASKTSLLSRNSSAKNLAGTSSSTQSRRASLSKRSSKAGSSINVASNASTSRRNLSENGKSTTSVPSSRLASKSNLEEPAPQGQADELNPDQSDEKAAAQENPQQEGDPSNVDSPTTEPTGVPEPAPEGEERAEKSVSENPEGDVNDSGQEKRTSITSHPPTADSENADSGVQDKEEVDIQMNNRIQSFEDLEDDDVYYDDQINVTSATARLVESPTPSLAEEAFMFVNVEYGTDPDLPVVSMCSALSRSNSWDWGLNKEIYGGDFVEVEGAVTPVMRPSTPEAPKVEISPEQVGVSSDETPEQDAGEPTQQDNVEDEINQLLPEATEEVDRETVINEIRDLMEIREKHAARNIYFQNLLGEYFKKKRVFSTFTKLR